MSIGSHCETIERYLQKEHVQPLIVDVQNPHDYNAIVSHFHVGENQFINASDYCNADELPRMESLLNDMGQNEGTVFVTGISEFLKLQGDTVLKNTLLGILNMTVLGHVVILTYQCSKYLSFHDPRLRNRILIIESEETIKTELVFTTPDLAKRFRGTTVKGIQKIVRIEEKPLDCLYVVTGKRRESYPLSLLPIKNMNRAYDILCSIDTSTSSLSESLGTEEKWSFALNQFFINSTWTSVVAAAFGSTQALDLAFHEYTSFDENKRWLYFLGLKLYGVPNNQCLGEAVASARQEENLPRAIYRSILSHDPKEKGFSKLYTQRKRLLHQLGNPLSEVVDFCKLITIKGKNALYYLTDNTQKEKETVFAVIDKYGLEFDREGLLSALKIVYPDLRLYLTPYRFKSELLNTYFEQYKYQKVINKVFPEFTSIVEEQAEKREYNLLLQPRTAVVESIDRTGAQLYFMDAMGVEYLGYIGALCQELKLTAKTTVCRCELPSITSKNKEFLDLFNDAPYQTVSIKDLDEIKHHGEDSFDYRKTKLPVYLIRELEIIRDVLTSIKERLENGTIQKAVMIADHGASRLAVLHETENLWEMSEKGEHSGRCCMKSEIDSQPSFATDAGDYWALANYDRFRGGRKANVEVHGGATLEEVTVPIIELTYTSKKAEIHILSPNATSFEFDKIPEITVSFRKKAAIKIYISTDLPDISVVVDGKQYFAAKTEESFYMVEMPELKRPKTEPYYVDVYSGGTIVAPQLPLRVKSEGMGSTNKGIL